MSIPITAKKRAIIRAEGARVAEILGRGTGGLSAKSRQNADELIEGRIPYLHGESAEGGRQDIDWSARHRDHHVWAGCLLRFQYTSPLLATWRETGE